MLRTAIRRNVGGRASGGSGYNSGSKANNNLMVGAVGFAAVMGFLMYLNKGKNVPTPPTQQTSHGAPVLPRPA
ncbi:hypothetical protein CC2G_014112 [Coprinopsis cinerea AmutBmut pab1-1]|nr:hypothetical protein CC2G_014112 [Coprinopsis cinerea AmutBmut pab1-1]